MLFDNVKDKIRGPAARHAVAKPLQAGCQWYVWRHMESYQHAIKGYLEQYYGDASSRRRGRLQHQW